MKASKLSKNSLKENPIKEIELKETEIVNSILKRINLQEKAKTIKPLGKTFYNYNLGFELDLIKYPNNLSYLIRLYEEISKILQVPENVIYKNIKKLRKVVDDRHELIREMKYLLGIVFLNERELSDRIQSENAPKNELVEVIEFITKPIIETIDWEKLKRLKEEKEKNEDKNIHSYNTGFEIDLMGRAGNLFCILIICNELAKGLGMSKIKKRVFNGTISRSQFQEALAVCKEWFGIKFLNEKKRLKELGIEVEAKAETKVEIKAKAKTEASPKNKILEKAFNKETLKEVVKFFRLNRCNDANAININMNRRVANA